MSSYKDIYRDLPSRIHHIWKEMRDKSITYQGQDASVTTMLMAAAAGFAMPLEHLRETKSSQGNKWKDHPAFNNVSPQKFNRTREDFRKFFDSKISECPGLKDGRLIHNQKLGEIRESAQSEVGDASLDVSRHDVRFAVRILRNALAHNNICDIPNANEKIEKLIFFSASTWPSQGTTSSGWFVLIISVESFGIFLEEWFQRLNETDAMAGAAMALADDEIA